MSEAEMNAVLAQFFLDSFAEDALSTSDSLDMSIEELTQFVNYAKFVTFKKEA